MEFPSETADTKNSHELIPEVEALRAALAAAEQNRQAVVAELAAALPLSDDVLQLLSDAAEAARAGQDELSQLEQERNGWFQEAVSASLQKSKLEEVRAGLTAALADAKRESAAAAARAEAAAAAAAALPPPTKIAEATTELRAAQEGMTRLSEGLHDVAQRGAAVEAALRDALAQVKASPAPHISVNFIDY
jgi:hypothetical protein